MTYERDYNNNNIIIITINSNAIEISKTIKKKIRNFKNETGRLFIVLHTPTRTARGMYVFIVFRVSGVSVGYSYPCVSDVCVYVYRVYVCRVCVCMCMRVCVCRCVCVVYACECVYSECACPPKLQYIS